MDEAWEARFWSKVRKTETCWEWVAGKDHGYGIIQAGGRARKAHRLAYEMLVGPIPAGLILDHLCRNRSCVNPAHLEVVTNRENVLRGVGPTAANAAKTHCVRGHAFTPENTIRRRGTQRDCRACKNLWEREQNAKARVAA